MQPVSSCQEAHLKDMESSAMTTNSQVTMELSTVDDYNNNIIII